MARINFYYGFSPEPPIEPGVQVKEGCYRGGGACAVRDVTLTPEHPLRQAKGDKSMVYMQGWMPQNKVSYENLRKGKDEMLFGPLPLLHGGW